MRIITDTVTIDVLHGMAKNIFGEFVKAVVDIDREIIALEAELHSDLEALLLENGSKQQNLWGINLYPEIQDENFIEYDSMINMRPGQGNRSRGVENETVRDRIIAVVAKRVKK